MRCLSTAFCYASTEFNLRPSVGFSSSEREKTSERFDEELVKSYAQSLIEWAKVEKAGKKETIEKENIKPPVWGSDSDRLGDINEEGEIVTLTPAVAEELVTEIMDDRLMENIARIFAYVIKEEDVYVFEIVEILGDLVVSDKIGEPKMSVFCRKIQKISRLTYDKYITIKYELDHWVYAYKLSQLSPSDRNIIENS